MRCCACLWKRPQMRCLGHPTLELRVAHGPCSVTFRGAAAAASKHQSEGDEPSTTAFCARRRAESTSTGARRSCKTHPSSLPCQTRGPDFQDVTLKLRFCGASIAFYASPSTTPHFCRLHSSSSRTNTTTLTSSCRHSPNSHLPQDVYTLISLGHP